MNLQHQSEKPNANPLGGKLGADDIVPGNAYSAEGIDEEIFR